ncbi:DUF5958 family protein [Streptomyces drozdowiczii]|uniref:DUF5958 family protein n=1 Tax=Streptomyces drozdowiczii TaxID=202862 RepID=A0ABY6Q1L3_9ACTN|nr:DUF5958 family protein [Streptomyces drozdowiczii]MCX0241922.1 DUF5958 family protein [Streptomyces drozdowiczii]UZK57966.1 DUF5958 family protein [Streptomyces drozdowiczii]
MTERDLILNELAQGLRPMSQGIEWFDTHSPEEQAEILLFLRHHCVQARAVTEDGPESIRRAVPHLSIGNDLPGISQSAGRLPRQRRAAAPARQRPAARPCPLPRGEHELIAAYVSQLNRTRFSSDSHGAFAAAQFDAGKEVVTDVLNDEQTAPVTEQLRALLRAAADVQRSPARSRRRPWPPPARRVRLSMYNRYVSCLDTELPADRRYYTKGVERIVAHGYGSQP